MQTVINKAIYHVFIQYTKVPLTGKYHGMEFFQGSIHIVTYT